MAHRLLVVGLLCFVASGCVAKLTPGGAAVQSVTDAQTE